MNNTTKLLIFHGLYLMLIPAFMFGELWMFIASSHGGNG